MIPNTLTDEELMQAINKLDLEPIKLKLMDKKEGEGWTIKQANAVEKWYKRFLFLCGKYPLQTLVPSPEIDIFWRRHILDTKKYERDCDITLGWSLHHFPYLDLLGEEDGTKKLADSVANTWALYEKHFSESVHELINTFNSETDLTSKYNYP